MASFFEKLAFAMGGEENITPEFRQTFADYDAFTMQQPMVGTTAAEVIAPPTTSAAPTPSAGDISSLFDSIRQGAMGGSGGFGGFTQSTGSVTTGSPSPGGLYGGNVTYTPGESAYGPINPASYLGDKKEGAANLSAAVNRAQYQDYLNRFAPIEDFTIKQLQGRQTADMGYDVARANQSAINAGVNLQGQQERAMGRYGLQYKGPTIANSNEVAGGRVAAMNQARMADEERALGLLAGGKGGQ